MGYKDNSGTGISYTDTEGPYAATPLFNPDKTFVHEGSVRFDSSIYNGSVPVVFTTAATPVVAGGVFVYNRSSGAMRLNIGSASTPVFRSITNS